MMRLRTGLLLLAGVALLACVLSSVDARALEGAQVAADTVATASPMKPISTVISWKTGKKYGDKYAHKDKHGKSKSKKYDDADGDGDGDSTDGGDGDDGTDGGDGDGGADGGDGGDGNGDGEGSGDDGLDGYGDGSNNNGGNGDGGDNGDGSGDEDGGDGSGDGNGDDDGEGSGDDDNGSGHGKGKHHHHKGYSKDPYCKKTCPAGPKGPKGPKGDDGEKGEKGECGPTGPAGPRGPVGGSICTSNPRTFSTLDERNVLNATFDDYTFAISGAWTCGEGMATLGGGCGYTCEDDKDWGKISITESHSSYAPADYQPYKARDSPVYCAWYKAGVKKLYGTCKPFMTITCCCAGEKDNKHYSEEYYKAKMASPQFQPLKAVASTTGVPLH